MTHRQICQTVGGREALVGFSETDLCGKKFSWDLLFQARVTGEMIKYDPGRFELRDPLNP